MVCGSKTPADDELVLRSDDLLPIRAFERLRPMLHPAIAALRDARRCHVGPHVTISFENRETVLWHLHEILRVEDRSAPHQVHEEVRRYDCLVPRAGELRATLMVHGGTREERDRLNRLVASSPGVVSLCVGGVHCVADCVESEPSIDSPIRYVRFAVAKRGIEPLDFLTRPVELALHVQPEASTSASSALRDALATDLNVGSLLEQEAAE